MSGNNIFRFHYDPSMGRLILVLDVKMTGTNASDQIVAVGICAMTYDRRIVLKRRIGIRLRTEEEIRLMNAGRMSWRDLWNHPARGYDIRCFDRFWAHRIDKLNMLQDDSYITLVNNAKELAYEINFILKEIEEQAQDVDLVTNTTAFDTLHIGRILADNYLQPLHFSRDGRYRWTYHSTSYLLGLWGGAISKMEDAHWAVFEKWLETEIDTIMPAGLIYTRADPENDAYFIGCRWQNANIYAERKMEKRMRQFAENANDKMNELVASSSKVATRRAARAKRARR